MPTSGFGQGLAALLGVGGSRADAFDQGQKAASEIKFRSAQTEGALAEARKNQAEALKQEKVNALEEELAKNPAALATADDETIGRLILSGRANQYSDAQQGRLRQQEFGNRAVAADPTAHALDRTRALQAVEGKPSADTVKVGKGYVNLTQDNAPVQFLGDEIAGDLSTAGKNFLFEQQLREKNHLPALTPEQQVENFREQSRADRIVNAGGVPTFANGTAVVDPSTVASNTQAVAGAKTTGTGLAKRELDLPAAKARLAAFTKKATDTSNLAHELQNDENLWKAVGFGQPIASISGSGGDAVRAKIRTLKSKLTLGALQELRDNSKTGGALGNVSNKDLSVLEDNIAALDARLSPEAFREQLQKVIDYTDELNQRLTGAFNETYPGISQSGQAPAAGGSPPLTGQARTSAAPAPATSVPRTNAQGWKLKRDAQGNMAYVGPKGEIEEVQ